MALWLLSCESGATVPDLLVQIVTVLFVGGAAYGAIRADLRAMHQRIERVSEDVDRVADRVDKILLNGVAK